MITRYGITLTLFGVASAVLGRVFGVIELYLIAAALVALTVACVLAMLLSRVRLQVLRSVNPSRVFVDESGPKSVFWVGSNNGASIVKLETLD